MHSNIQQLLTNSTLLVTGGTGSFGRVFVKSALAMGIKKIIVFSRDEMKQWEMARELGNNERVRFFLGDVRDRERLYRACDGVDFIVHAAAMKIIPSAEYNPFECIKTNVMGAMNLIDCAIDRGVKRVVALSTDKACNPINLYGATKLCSDKLFVSGNAYSTKDSTRFSVVRYGNVMGSRGSVIPFFLSLAKGAKVPITDSRMTRFMITLDEAVDLVWLALNEAVGGEIFVKKIPSMNVVDIARALRGDAELDCVGIRPGEKLHEQMISVEDARHTYEFDNHFCIVPETNLENNAWRNTGKLCPDGFEYSSETNTSWMSIPQLQAWVSRNFDWKAPAIPPSSLEIDKSVQGQNQVSSQSDVMRQLQSRPQPTENSEKLLGKTIETLLDN